MRIWSRRGNHALSSALVVLGLAQGMAHAREAVICHTTYGGETRRLSAAPVGSPYSVGTVDIGSYFRFRIVFRNRPADLASIKVYTYADMDDGPVLLHHATYRYPPVAGKKHSHGFSGLQFVYEPLRDGELHYWCEWLPVAPQRTKGK